MKLGLSKVKSTDTFDFVLTTYLILMAIMSIASLYSAIGMIGAQTSWDLITKQSMWFMIGTIAFGCIMYLGNHSMVQFAKIAYWFLMACLIYLLLSKISFHVMTKNLPFIQAINGATSWFTFPALGSFQPSEFMKIVLILITANIIDEHNKHKIKDSYEMDFSLFLEVGKWALPPMLLIFVQPDTGLVIIIILSLLAMIACSGIKKQWLIIAAILCVSLLALFFYMYYFHFELLNRLVGGNDGYKLKRITTWLNPHKNILGVGNQLYTALMVIGSAGLTGFGAGKDLLNIPEVQTDFIFASIGQSWGLFGTLFIVVLCAGLDIHLLRIASKSKNMFEKFFILGILGMLLYQQIQNMGMIIGLLPITGITLPLISYGGSSLLSYLLAFGIIMNASAKAKKSTDYSYK